MTPQTTFVNGISPWGAIITQVARPCVPAIKAKPAELAKPIKAAKPVKAKASPRIRRTPRLVTGKRAAQAQAQNEIVEAVKANPGLTHRQLASVMHQDPDAVKGRIKYLIRAGRLHTTIKPGKFGVVALLYTEPQTGDGLESTMPYSLRITRQQRITLLKLGGPDYFRQHLDAQTVRMNHAQNENTNRL